MPKNKTTKKPAKSFEESLWKTATKLRHGIQAVENLWSKYAVTAKTIEAERDNASKELQQFLVELGYE